MLDAAYERQQSLRWPSSPGGSWDRSFPMKPAYPMKHASTKGHECMGRDEMDWMVQVGMGTAVLWEFRVSGRRGCMVMCRGGGCRSSTGRSMPNNKPVPCPLYAELKGNTEQPVEGVGGWKVGEGLVRMRGPWVRLQSLRVQLCLICGALHCTGFHLTQPLSTALHCTVLPGGAVHPPRAAPLQAGEAGTVRAPFLRIRYCWNVNKPIWHAWMLGQARCCAARKALHVPLASAGRSNGHEPMSREAPQTLMHVRLATTQDHRQVRRLARAGHGPCSACTAQGGDLEGNCQPRWASFSHCACMPVVGCMCSCQ